MFFGKLCLNSKSSSGNVESRSDNAPDNFPPKVRFFHKNLKNSPPAHAPRSEKTIKLNIYPGIKIFPEEVYLDR